MPGTGKITFGPCLPEEPVAVEHEADALRLSAKEALDLPLHLESDENCLARKGDTRSRGVDGVSTAWPEQRIAVAVAEGPERQKRREKVS